MDEEPKKYHLEIFGAMALSKPVQGSTRFNWNESKSLDGKKRSWYSDEEVFQIEEDLEESQYPFLLIMHVIGGKSCSAGPFHSLAARKNGNALASTEPNLKICATKDSLTST
jgi:hypothetical protein